MLFKIIFSSNFKKERKACFKVACPVKVFSKYDHRAWHQRGQLTASCQSNLWHPRQAAFWLWFGGSQIAPAYWWLSPMWNYADCMIWLQACHLDGWLFYVCQLGSKLFFFQDNKKSLDSAFWQKKFRLGRVTVNRDIFFWALKVHLGFFGFPG